jgi:voltage-gated potassium channel
VWQRRLNAIIFRTDTAAGRAFDIVVMIGIALSVAALVLESIPSIGSRYAWQLRAVEWFFIHLAHYLDEANYLIAAIRASYYKIIVFIFTVVTVVLVLGALIYAVEGEANGFTSIWTGVYWAIGTLTTTDAGGSSATASSPCRRGS